MECLQIFIGFLFLFTQYFKKISENQKEESVRYEEELSRKNFLFASIQNFSEICSDMQGLNNEIKEYGNNKKNTCFPILQIKYIFLIFIIIIIAILNDNSDQNNLGNKKMTKEKLAKKLDRMDMVEKDFRENY